MRATWHRSEPRDIRPFFETFRANDAVSESKIRLFDDDEPTAETQFNVEDSDLQRLRPVILPSVVPLERWMPAGYTANEFGLVVLATNPYLRLSAVVQEISLDQAIPERVALPLNVMNELGGGRNLTVTLAVHLRADRPPSPGRPFVVGHWLARKDFAIRMPSEGRFFDVQFRTDEEWIAAGYPAKTFYAVEYHGGICEEIEPDSSVATVWVHADAYTRISSERLGEGITKILAVEVIVQILQESIDDWKNLEAVEQRSPLATVLRKLDRDTPISIADLKSLVQGPKKKTIRALLHDDMGLVRAFS